MAYIGIPVFKQDELTSVKRMRESMAEDETGTSAGAQKGWATRKGGQYKKDYERDEAEKREYELQDRPQPAPKKKVKRSLRRKVV